MTNTPKWRLETREDIDGGTYKAWTDEPTPAILRGAEELRSLYLADQTQPVSYFVESVQTAAGAVLDVEEMAAAYADAQFGPGGWDDAPAAIRNDIRRNMQHVRNALLGDE